MVQFIMLQDEQLHRLQFFVLKVVWMDARLFRRMYLRTL
jgi:hypothetical protein